MDMNRADREYKKMFVSLENDQKFKILGLWKEHEENERGEDALWNDVPEWFIDEYYQSLEDGLL